MFSFSFFQLVLENPSKLIWNIINKDLGISIIFLEEDLKLWLNNKSGTLVAAILLGLSETNNITEE